MRPARRWQIQSWEPLIKHDKTMSLSPKTGGPYGPMLMSCSVGHLHDLLIPFVDLAVIFFKFLGVPQLLWYFSLAHILQQTNMGWSLDLVKKGIPPRYIVTFLNLLATIIPYCMPYHQPSIIYRTFQDDELSRGQPPARSVIVYIHRYENVCVWLCMYVLYIYTLYIWLYVHIYIYI